MPGREMSMSIGWGCEREHVHCLRAGESMSGGAWPVTSRPRPPLQGSRRPCPAAPGIVARLRARHPWGAAGRGRRDFLGRHDEREGDDDVGAPGADGARAVGTVNELAKRVRQAAVDPVADHNAGPERGTGEELQGQGQWRTHQNILRRGACVTSR